MTNVSTPESGSSSDVPSGPDTGERLEAQGVQIREAAKWLIGSFAAVGAALIAGSQLSSIGRLPVCVPNSLECGRLWIAVVGAVAALLGVVWAIWTGVGLLTPVKLQVSDLKREWREGTPIHDYFQADRLLLQGFDDFEDMDKQEKDASARFDELNDHANEVGEDEAEQYESDLAAAEFDLLDIQARSDDVVTIANHVKYVHTFKHQALKKLVAAAAVAALGIVAFAWSANPPLSLTSVSLRHADLSDADLSGANLRGADLTGAELRNVDFTGADLRGADLTDADLEGVIWSETVCPDGSQSDSADGSCENRLVPEPSADSE